MAVLRKGDRDRYDTFRASRQARVRAGGKRYNELQRIARPRGGNRLLTKRVGPVFPLAGRGPFVATAKLDPSQVQDRRGARLPKMLQSMLTYSSRLTGRSRRPRR